MSTMNISLPDSLKNFVDERVSDGDYSTSSEYLRELIRKDQDRLKLRTLILEGAASELNPKPLGKDYFDVLRKRSKRS